MDRYYMHQPGEYGGDNLTSKHYGQDLWGNPRSSDIVGRCTVSCRLPYSNLGWRRERQTESGRILRTEITNCWWSNPSHFATTADVYSAIVFLRQMADDTRHLYEVLSGGFADKGWKRVVRGLRIIKESPWWHRVWVLRETILPSNATTHFGSIIVPWRIVTMGIERLGHHYDICCFDFMDKNHWKELGMVRAINTVVGRLKVLQDYHAGATNLILSQLMNSHRVMKLLIFETKCTLFYL